MARVVSFHYILKNRQGKVLDSTEGGDPFTYLEGSRQIIAGLEKQLRGVNQGDKRIIEVGAREGYGLRDEKRVVQMSKQQFPPGEKIEMGDEFKLTDDTSSDTSSVFRVTGLSNTHVTLDGNHPLAGEDLLFDLEVTEIREATAQELKHRHTHGDRGHDH